MSINGDGSRRYSSMFFLFLCHLLLVVSAQVFYFLLEIERVFCFEV